MRALTPEEIRAIAGGLKMRALSLSEVHVYPPVTVPPPVTHAPPPVGAPPGSGGDSGGGSGVSKADHAIYSVDELASLVQQYGDPHYKPNPNIHFTESNFYAYQETTGGPTLYSSTKPSSGDMEIFGHSTYTFHGADSVIYQGGLQGVTNESLYYIDVGNLQNQPVLKSFTLTAAEMEVMTYQHELYHVLNGDTASTPTTEGYANYYGYKAAMAFKAATGK